MTHVPRRLYGHVTYSNQKEAYVFGENDAIFPIQNSMYVIYHDPTKRSFEYDKKTKQFQQFSIHKCELTTRHL